MEGLFESHWRGFSRLTFGLFYLGTVFEKAQPKWPDAKLKIISHFSKSCPKSNHSSLTWKVLLFIVAQKFTMHLGYLETMIPRTFKNRLIWSHWAQRLQVAICMSNKCVSLFLNSIKELGESLGVWSPLVSPSDFLYCSTFMDDVIPMRRSHFTIQIHST